MITTRWTVRFEGRVQGVGFRFAVVQAASGFPVKGFVRNQVDGSVLVVAEGHPQQLEAFVLRIYRVATGARISGEERRESAATNEFDGFHVRYA